MSTRSNIGIMEADGTVTTIYCLWDGSPSHNGRILLTHYRSPAQVQNLMELGDLSVLGAGLGKAQSFEAPDTSSCPFCGAPAACLAYGRDRGQDDVAAVKYSNLEALRQNMQEYAYVFVNGVWMFSDHEAEFRPLTREDCV